MNLKYVLSLFLLTLTLSTWAKNKRLDSVDCNISKQTYGSVLECGDELYSIKMGSQVEKSLHQICRDQFKCKISFEVNGRDEVVKILSAFSKGKKQAQTFPTSFDCRKAKNQAEKIVCTHEDLARLDNQLGAKIKRALETTEDTKKVRDEQKTWIKQKRDKCEDKDCLMREYQKRLELFESKAS